MTKSNVAGHGRARQGMARQGQAMQGMARNINQSKQLLKYIDAHNQYDILELYWRSL